MRSLNVGVTVLLLAAMVAGCVTRTPAPVGDRRPGASSMPEPAPQPPLSAPVAEGAGSPSSSSSSSPSPPPPPQERDWRPEFYTVKRGDTLFAIALEHGLDYRELAALNNIENLNVIRVGQILRVRMPGDAAPSVAAGPATAPLVTAPPVTEGRPVAATRTDRPNSDTYKTQPRATKLPYSEAALAQLQSASQRSESPAVVVPATPIAAAAPAGAGTAGTATLGASAVAGTAGSSAAGAGSATIGPLASVVPSTAGVPTSPVPAATATEAGDEQVDWGWPVKGKIVNGFSETASLKGIDISGAKGIPVVASAPGRVVYAGSGLRGYGKLVIVKHNKTYLSAYAHLDQISIREGQNVTKGQEIGKMGNSDADQVKLHFEIRSLGKPVDPMRFLPRG